MTITNKFWVGGWEKQYSVECPWQPWSKPSQRSSPQQQSHSSCPVLVTLLTRLLPTSLPFNHRLLSYIYILLPVCTTWWALIYTFTQYPPSHQQPYSLSGYQYPEVHSWYSNLIINTTKPLGYSLYIIMSLFQGLTQMYLFFFGSIIPCDVLHKWGCCNSPYTWGHQCMYLSIGVVKTSQPLQVQIMSGSRVPLGDFNFTLYPY